MLSHTSQMGWCHGYLFSKAGSFSSFSVSKENNNNLVCWQGNEACSGHTPLRCLWSILNSLAHDYVTLLSPGKLKDNHLLKSVVKKKKEESFFPPEICVWNAMWHKHDLTTAEYWGHKSGIYTVIQLYMWFHCILRRMQNSSVSTGFVNSSPMSELNKITENIVSLQSALQFCFL